MLSRSTHPERAISTPYHALKQRDHWRAQFTGEAILITERFSGMLGTAAHQLICISHVRAANANLKALADLTDRLEF